MEKFFLFTALIMSVLLIQCSENKAINSRQMPSPQKSVNGQGMDDIDHDFDRKPFLPFPSYPLESEEKVDCTPFNMGELMQKQGFEASIIATPLLCLEALFRLSEDAHYDLYQQETLESMLVFLEKSRNESNRETKITQLSRLMKYFRVGFYHSFYEKAFAGFNADIIAEKLHTTLIDIFRENDLLTPSKDTLYLLRECIGLLDSMGLIGGGIEKLYVSVLQYYVEFPVENMLNIDRDIVYALLFLMQRNYNSDEIPSIISDSNFVAHASALIIKYKDHKEYQSILGNGLIWSLGKIASNKNLDPSSQKAIHDTLVQVYSENAKFSEYNMWAIKSLSLINPCPAIAQNSPVCLGDYKKELIAKLFPHKYRKKSGKIDFVFRTSHSEQIADNLIPHIQAVEDFFFKHFSFSIPLDDIDNNELTLMIYTSKEDYQKYHTFLYDLGTSNGGIYIEKDQTLYTFDRSENESKYSLVDLVKHEVAHYYINRFIIPGQWGLAAIFKDTAFTWFEEGLAEFLSQAQDAEHSKIKQVTLDIISQYKPSEHMTVAGIINSSYADGSLFYPYAAMLINEMYDASKPLLDAMLQAASSQDSAGFNGFIHDLKTPKEEKGYQSYLFQKIVLEAEVKADTPCGEEFLNPRTFIDKVNRTIIFHESCHFYNFKKNTTNSGFYYLANIICEANSLGADDIDELIENTKNEYFALSLDQSPLGTYLLGKTTSQICH